MARTPKVPPRRRISDVNRIRALAHPLRMAVLRHLMAVGPRTASECAVEVGSTPSNCSWHLRQLATFGLVEPAESAGGRDRPWRATPVGLDFGEPASDPVVREAQDSVIAVSLQDEAEMTRRFFDHRDDLDDEWVSASRFDSYVVRVTPEELRELMKSIDDVLRPYVATVRPKSDAEALLAYVGLRAFSWLDATGTPT
ncbi:helix-turn-helix domain-containing protein [Lentzea sp. NBC_00516]|uniref:winged helix-turn-helix domain-containing protein n=1 Tax=Lentzea sp. NBC_00516 TaxID=2903582 RepID=UPI002E80FB8B|nr:helix-turn-helix domain-containing protein [Lentzea sp. NBC_00516]WUD27661.1 helix-turn-helix domain-containing protein [Lentzea sp. NBC_00516]